MHAVPAYDPDSQFSVGALSRLEAAGIPVLTELEKVGDWSLSADTTSHKAFDDMWFSKKLGTRPPTWRSLYEVLRELDLEELSQEIEEYLSCECVMHAGLCDHNN